MTSIQASLPFPTQPWETAKNRFLDGLSPEEAKKFEEATAENLLIDASAAQKKHAQGSRSWILQERLLSLADGIDDYGKAIDVYAQAYPLVLSPIWGSIRVVLHIVREAGKFQEKLVDMLAQIGDVLPRFRIYQDLFGNHERLLRALSDAYLDVLRFCVRAKEFFVRAKGSLIPLSITLRRAWRAFRTDFDSNMVQFRKHQKLVEKEVNLAHIIEAAKARELEQAQRALLAQNAKVKRRHKILANLPTVEYQEKHAKLSALQHPGTNKWLLEHRRFKSWISSRNFDCLPIFGIPGSGKSVLAASVANDLMSSSRNAGTIVCYYYCEYSDAASLSPDRLVGSLARQILVQLPIDNFDDKFSCPFEEGKPIPNFGASVEFLSRLLINFKAAFIVIDGLDELAQECQRIVLTLIDHLLKCGTTIKLLLTSRSEEHQIKRLLSSYEGIHISANRNQEDIAIVIRTEIDSMLVKLNPLLENKRLKQEIVDALAAGAQGMFLWVKFQLYDIVEALTETSIRTTLQSLPRSLADTYYRIIWRAYCNSGTASLVTMKKVFNWIACARRPLRIEELEEAIGLEKTDLYLHAERTANNAGERLISTCRNLVICNEDRTVTFAHHTVLQFLSSFEDFTPSASTLTPIYPSFEEITPSMFKELIHVDLIRSNHEIGEICIAYLSFSDFETQLVSQPKPSKLEQQTAEYLIWTRVPLGSQIRGLMSLGRSRQQISPSNIRRQIDIACPVSTKPAKALVKMYALLDYIVTYWPYHTADFRQSDPCWSSFRHVALHRHAIFQFRPWQDELHQATTFSRYHESDTARTLGISLRLTETIESLSIYTWALERDIPSLLSLSAILDSCPAMKKAYGGNLEFKSRSKPLFQAFTLTTIPKFTKIWSGEFLYFCIMQCDRNNPSQIKNSMKVIESEYDNWGNLACPNKDELFREAMLYALQLGNDTMFSIILKHHVRTSEQLFKTFLSIIRGGHARRGPIRTLLYHIVSGRTSALMMFELSFALESQLPIIRDTVLQTMEMPYMETEILWLLTVLALVSPGYGDLAGALITNHFIRHGIFHRIPNITQNTIFTRKPEIACDKVLALPNTDWTSTAFGSERVYNMLLTIDGMDIIAIAFTQAHRFVQGCKRSHNQPRILFREARWPAILSVILNCINHSFQPEAYEIRGIHILNWVIEWEIDTSTDLLFRRYDKLAGDRKNAVLAYKIMKHAMLRGPAHMDRILQLRWSGTVLRRALAADEFKVLGPAHKLRLMEMESLNRRIKNFVTD